MPCLAKFHSRCLKIKPMIKSAASAASPMTKMQAALITGLIFKHRRDLASQPDPKVNLEGLKSGSRAPSPPQERIV